MHPTNYADLNGVLAQLVVANQALLADNFVGAYLHGSFAVGDPDEASDVDYMIVVERSHHDNTLVVRWQLRERGITLAGPDIHALIDPVPVDELRREVRSLMHSRGDGWFAKPENIANRFYQPFVVLTYSRMLHTLATGGIISKPAAATWAQASLDSRWSDLIRRAVADRPDPSRRFRTPADPDDVAETLEFMRHVIAISDTFVSGTPTMHR